MLRITVHKKAWLQQNPWTRKHKKWLASEPTGCRNATLVKTNFFTNLFQECYSNCYPKVAIYFSTCNLTKKWSPFLAFFINFPYISLTHGSSCFCFFFSVIKRSWNFVTVILIVDYVISECFLSLLLLLKCQFKNYTWECIANAKINK